MVASHRFFVPGHDLRRGDLTLSGDAAHRIRNVLRLNAGAQIVALDNSGWEFTVELTEVTRERVEGRVVHKALSAAEPRTKITLYQALIRPERFAYALQKGTEIGIVGFVPLICARGVVEPPSGDDRQRRWERIVQEAAEQARRAKLPRVHPVTSFAAACRGVAGLSLLPWEEAGSHGLTLKQALCGSPADAANDLGRPPRPFAVNIFVGPEGGFSADEVALARQHHIQPVTLGPRILRAETAGLAAAVAVLYEWGDLGG